MARFALRKAPSPGWKSPVGRAGLDHIIGAMLRCAGRPDASVDLVLLGDAAMEGLHGRTLGCAGPTNVLAFPSAPSPLARDHDTSLGSLALSLDTLERECFLYGQEPEEHCIRLLAHGLAHLLGNDQGPAMPLVKERLEAAALEVSAGAC